MSENKFFLDSDLLFTVLFGIFPPGIWILEGQNYGLCSTSARELLLVTF